MTIWFSSDLHLDHANIIRFCNRPFSNVREMNEFLLDIHNKYVKSSDHWYNLGDVTLRRGGRIDREWFINTLKKFNGHKRLILGNHDHLPIKTYCEAFEKVYGTWRGIDNILLSHIPIHPSSMGAASANVHGHIHNNQPSSFPPVIRIDKKTQKVSYHPYVNISVEVTDYRPLSLEELKDRVNKEKGEYEGSKVGEEATKSLIRKVKND